VTQEGGDGSFAGIRPLIFLPSAVVGFSLLPLSWPAVVARWRGSGEELVQGVLLAVVVPVLCES
jgi:hypothetical protein